MKTLLSHQVSYSVTYPVLVELAERLISGKFNRVISPTLCLFISEL